MLSSEEDDRAMNTRSLIYIAGVGTALVCNTANAQVNPFQMVEFGPATLLLADARDMQGNEVKVNPETGFTYGGDQQAGYANGKLGTGAKDPAVCGTFNGASCSMPHLQEKTP
jgi:hypothetical protein